MAGTHISANTRGFTCTSKRIAKLYGLTFVFIQHLCAYCNRGLTRDTDHTSSCNDKRKFDPNAMADMLSATTAVQYSMTSGCTATKCGWISLHSPLLMPCLQLLLQKRLEKSTEDSSSMNHTKHHPQHLCEKCQQLGYYCRRSDRSGGSFKYLVL